MDETKKTVKFVDLSNSIQEKLLKISYHRGYELSKLIVEEQLKQKKEGAISQFISSLKKYYKNERNICELLLQLKNNKGGSGHDVSEKITDVNIDDIVIEETKQFTYVFPKKNLSVNTDNETTGGQSTETSIDWNK